MEITFGAHEGKSVEQLLITQPGYVQWILGRPNAGGPLLDAQIEAKRLIAHFDRKPYLASCSKQDCTRPATRASVYSGECSPWFWCDGCDPALAGATVRKLHIVRGYLDALRYVDAFCRNARSHSAKLIRHLAEAKGLTRATRKELDALFA